MSIFGPLRDPWPWGCHESHLHCTVLHTKPDLNLLAAACHDEQLKWYTDSPTDDRSLRIFAAARLALIHSEISEALEGVRKDSMDDKLPHRKAEEVEIADALIRIFDYAGWRNLDIEGAVREKREYNRTRADHTAEARGAHNGKKF